MNFTIKRMKILFYFTKWKKVENLASQYISLNLTATTVEQRAKVRAQDVVYIINDDLTNDLSIAFTFEGIPVDDESWIVIKAQEKFYEFPTGIDVSVIAYKSSASTVSFRFLGNRNA